MHSQKRLFVYNPYSKQACLILPWGQFWERVFYKHKCIHTYFIARVLVENTLLNLKESLMVSDNSSFSVFPFHMLWFCSVYSTEFYLSLMWCSSFYSALLVFNFILKTKKRKLCNNLSTSLTVAVTTLFVDFGVFAQESVCVWAGFDFFYMVLDRKCEEMLVTQIFFNLKSTELLPKDCSEKKLTNVVLYLISGPKL